MIDLQEILFAIVLIIQIIVLMYWMYDTYQIMKKIKKLEKERKKVFRMYRHEILNKAESMLIQNKYITLIFIDENNNRDKYEVRDIEEVIDILDFNYYDYKIEDWENVFNMIKIFVRGDE